MVHVISLPPKLRTSSFPIPLCFNILKTDHDINRWINLLLLYFIRVNKRRKNMFSVRKQKKIGRGRTEGTVEGGKKQGLNDMCGSHTTITSFNQIYLFLCCAYGPYIISAEIHIISIMK